MSEVVLPGLAIAILSVVAMKPAVAGRSFHVDVTHRSNRVQYQLGSNKMTVHVDDRVRTSVEALQHAADIIRASSTITSVDVHSDVKFNLARKTDETSSDFQDRVAATLEAISNHSDHAELGTSQRLKETISHAFAGNIEELERTTVGLRNGVNFVTTDGKFINPPSANAELKVPDQQIIGLPLRLLPPSVASRLALEPRTSGPDATIYITARRLRSALAHERSPAERQMDTAHALAEKLIDENDIPLLGKDGKVISSAERQHAAALGVLNLIHHVLPMDHMLNIGDLGTAFADEYLERVSTLMPGGGDLFNIGKADWHHLPSLSAQSPDVTLVGLVQLTSWIGAFVEPFTRGKFANIEYFDEPTKAALQGLQNFHARFLAKANGITGRGSDKPDLIGVRQLHMLTERIEGLDRAIADKASNAGDPGQLAADLDFLRTRRSDIGLRLETAIRDLRDIIARRESGKKGGGGGERRMVPTDTAGNSLRGLGDLMAPLVGDEIDGHNENQRIRRLAGRDVPEPRDDEREPEQWRDPVEQPPESAKSPHGPRSRSLSELGTEIAERTLHIVHGVDVGQTNTQEMMAQISEERQANKDMVVSVGGKQPLKERWMAVVNQDLQKMYTPLDQKRHKAFFARYAIEVVARMLPYMAEKKDELIASISEEIGIDLLGQPYASDFTAKEGGVFKAEYGQDVGSSFGHIRDLQVKSDVYDELDINSLLSKIETAVNSTMNSVASRHDGIDPNVSIFRFIRKAYKSGGGSMRIVPLAIGPTTRIIAHSDPQIATFVNTVRRKGKLIRQYPDIFVRMAIESIAVQLARSAGLIVENGEEREPNRTTLSAFLGVSQLEMIQIFDPSVKLRIEHALQTMGKQFATNSELTKSPGGKAFVECLQNAFLVPIKRTGGKGKGTSLVRSVIDLSGNAKEAGSGLDAGQFIDEIAVLSKGSALNQGDDN